jgi:SpoVK/Ycf46/Vps4 family AAA+-type ATPase
MPLGPQVDLAALAAFAWKDSHDEDDDDEEDATKDHILLREMTGADIAAICKSAAMFALRENEEAIHVEMRHFRHAIQNRSCALRDIRRL